MRVINSAVFNDYQRGPLPIPGYIDPDAVEILKIYWGAPVFEVSTVYRLGDICRPTVDNGYYYECTTNGKSAATEPATWGQVTQVSGTAKFTAIPFDLFVLPGEAITSSSWSVLGNIDAPVLLVNTDYAVGDLCRPTTYVGYYYVCTVAGNVGPTEPGTWSTSSQTIGDAVFTAMPQVLLGNPSSDNEATTIQVMMIPSDISSFTITNHVVKDNGEERDKSFKYKVREQ